MTKEYSSAVTATEVKALRELACKQTGLTMAELIEAEGNVCHPKELISRTIAPAVMRRSRMQRAGVPERFIRAVGDSEPISCQPLYAVREWLQTSEAFLMLSGGKGTRKTGSAAWALTQLDAGGVFVESSDVLHLALEEPEKWQRVLDARLVVFDDLGVERRDGKSVFEAEFAKLFNQTYSQCKRLIITANLSPEVFTQTYDATGRTYDRLREVGRWIRVEGESVRGER